MNTTNTMTSSKPYLIRAIYEWILDNNYTPYITVDTTYPNTDVPQKYIQDNAITLDISPLAANKLLIANDAITFSARFGGIPHNIYIPIAAVLAIYSQKNAQGMAFPKEEYQPEINISSQSNTATQTKTNKAQFKIVTGGKKE